MRTRAATLYGLNEPLKIEEVEIGEPKAGEVLVKMVASGVCHTDPSVIHGLLPTPLPVILGHEGAGVVEAVGPGVTMLKPGDHVVVAAEPHCGHCRFCLEGKPFSCAFMMAWAFGGTMPDGTKRFRKNGSEISHFFCQSSFAEHTVVPERIAVKVPSDLPLEKLGPLACGVQTGAGAVLNTARVGRGESVAVFGCGGVGLSAVMGAKLARAFPIIAVDVIDSRLRLAAELGATSTIRAGSTDVVEEIRKQSGGGVDYSFECIGKTDTIRQAVDCSRPNGGTAVITGAAAAGSEAKLDTMSLILKNILGNIEGSSVPGVFIPMLIEFWRQGQFPFDRLTTKTYTLDQINEAIVDMERGVNIKPLIRF